VTTLLTGEESNIQAAAELLRRGELVAFPTETVYGIGAPIFFPASISKIFEVKNRPKDNPLIAHIGSLEQVAMIAENVSDQFYQLAEKFFPGPLTIILSKSESVPKVASAGLSTIGVRMPRHPIALNLIQKLGMPIAAPSANRSGSPSSTKAEHVLEDFGGKIAAILDGGTCEYGLESTVLLLEPQPVILRPGSITKEELEESLHLPVVFATEQNPEVPLSPGTKHKHYAPQAKVLLAFSEDELARIILNSTATKRVIHSCIQSNELYEKLREADREAIEEIIFICDEAVKEDAALMNRLTHAASIWE